MIDPPPSRQLTDLANALDEPLRHLDFWLGYADPAAASSIRGTVLQLGASGTERDIEVARLVTSLEPPPPGTITKLAERFGVTSGALSQQCKARRAALAELRNDPIFSAHPLVELWRDRAGRLVHVDDLPTWMSGYLTELVPTGEWGDDADVFRVLLHVALDEPVLIDIRSAATSEKWLLSAGADLADGPAEWGRNWIEGLITKLAGESYRILSLEEYVRALAAAGVARSAIKRVREVVERKPIWRVIEHDEQVLLFSPASCKRVELIGAAVMQEFSLTREETIHLISERQGRNLVSVRNSVRDVLS